MRWTQTFIPTLKESPADAEIASHKLLLRAGLIRKLGTHSDLAPGTMHMLNRRGTISIEKARARLGYEPLVSLDEGFATVKEWAAAEGMAAAPNTREVA